MPNVTPEPALLRHMHFQSNYNNTYQGRRKDTEAMNTIAEEIEEDDDGKEPENSLKGGGKKKVDELRYSLPKEFDTTKTQPRILSIFQQDYQVPYLTESLKPPSKRRPVDCYRPCEYYTSYTFKLHVYAPLPTILHVHFHSFSGFSQCLWFLKDM